MAVYWHGTRQEASALLHAISSHCSCEPATQDASTTRGPSTAGDARDRRCPPHLMLVEDQRAVDGLLFVRNIVGRLLLEEWDLTQTGWATTDRPASPASELPAFADPGDSTASTVAPRVARA